MDLHFRAPLIWWRGPAPFVFAAIPDEVEVDLRLEPRR
jgi:hypothetical protein